MVMMMGRRSMARGRPLCLGASCKLQVASCEQLVASCEWRSPVASCKLQINQQLFSHPFFGLPLGRLVCQPLS